MHRSTEAREPTYFNSFAQKCLQKDKFAKVSCRSGRHHVEIRLQRSEDRLFQGLRKGRARKVHAGI